MCADFCSLLPAWRSTPPARITLAKNGSRISAFPNASITIMVSVAPPPMPPSSSANGKASRPSSAYWFHIFSLKPVSPARYLPRASKPYWSFSRRSTLSFSMVCSSERSKSILVFSRQAGRAGAELRASLPGP
jgi:hypothetical protein